LTRHFDFKLTHLSLNKLLLKVFSLEFLGSFQNEEYASNWVNLNPFSTGHPVQVARFDVLGRTTSTTQTQLDGGWTQAFTTYTARGQVAQQSEPTRGAPPVWTTFQYADILGRMTQKSVPKQAQDGRGDLVTRYSYAGRTTTIQVCGSNDAGTGNCLNLSRTTDSLGRYVETRDALNGRTRFWYEANGNVAAIEDAKNVVTRAAYNAIGQRSAVNDPNQGNWSFVYNALGEVISQTDARSIVTTMAYDKLGRPTSRNATIDVTGDTVADTVADSWTYDPAGALGAPLMEQRTINGVTERRSTLTYDSLARPVQTDVLQALTTGTQTYTLKTKYDSYYGRPVGQRFPNGETLQVVYGQYGDALVEQDPITGSEYRRLNSVNARGQATQETFGNGVVLNPQYHVQTGQLTELRYTKNGSDVRKLGYGYDVFGNLKQQTLNGGQSQEDYSYDQLHRLVQSIRSGAASGTVSYGFDAVGNFSKKTDFSANTSNAYVYTGGSCGGGANAVRSVTLANNTTRTFCYDLNGNLTSDNAGLSIKYDHMNLPTVAQRGANRDDFRYGADGMRTRSWGADGSRVYLPGYEHKLDTNETKVYIGDYAVITSGGGNPRKIEYLLKDRLGSVDAITNSSGTVTETRGYDAFGKPRSGTWADLNPAKMASTAVTPKGFTQHEHLNQLELIHMNGRVFDYNLGRFTGVDPFIQFPLNSQSLNPYSYLMNGPLSGTDPTGYTCSSDKSVGDCSAQAGAGKSVDVVKQDVGSRIKIKVGTVTNNGNGTATVTNRDGNSATVNLSNGGSGGQGTMGSSGRKDHVGAVKDKGSQPNAAQLDVAGSAGAKAKSAKLSSNAAPEGNWIDKDEQVMEGDAEMYKSAQKIKRIPGVYTMVAHGWATNNGLEEMKEDGEGVRYIYARLPGTDSYGRYNASQIWAFIKNDVQNGKYLAILVLACGAGITDETGNSFLSDLSRVSEGRVVIGTNALYGLSPAGRAYPANGLFKGGHLSPVPISGARWDKYKNGEKYFDGIPQKPSVTKVN
jgi:RHS repeat-associated protein